MQIQSVLLFLTNIKKYKMEKMEITNDKLDKIILFIRNSKYDLIEERVHPYNLRILMPSFLKRVIDTYYKSLYSIGSKPFEGIETIEVLPHYKNEVVVYDGEDFRFKQTKYRILTLDEILK